jgi:hypothetical protein
MATTYTWTIPSMMCFSQDAGQANVVVVANWLCEGSDGKYASRRGGQSQFAYTPGAPFTPYDQLTQDQVLNWCWDSNVDKAGVEAVIDAEIQESKQAVTITTPPLPWAA